MKRTRKLSSHFKSSSGLMAATALALLLQAAFIVALPWPVKYLIDGILTLGTADFYLPFFDLIPALVGHTPPSAQVALAAVFLVLTLLAAAHAALARATQGFLARLAFEVSEKSRSDLLALLIESRESFFERRKAQDLVERISHDTATVGDALAQGFVIGFRSLPSLLLIVTLILFMNPSGSIAAIASIPLIYLITISFSESIRRHQTRAREEKDSFERDTAWALSTLFSIKSLTLEEATLGSLLSQNGTRTENELAARRLQGTQIAVITGIVILVLAASIMMGGTSVLEGKIPIGSLIVTLAYIAWFPMPIGQIAKYISILPRARASRARLESLYRDLETQGETEGTQNTASLPFPDATSLHFENVSFAHEPGKMILRGFNADFDAGELIALVGPSGVGKSTFARLMNRMLDPVEGKILLGRTDLRRYRLNLLRRTITYINRSPYFVRGTIRENLLLTAGEAELDEQKISEALHAAAVSDFIGTLPDKLETRIGVGGYPLSDTESKRLHLARAFLRTESLVFVFDEPTSGLDRESALEIMESIRELADRGAIVFWMGRDLSPVPLADRVVYFQPGENPVVGSHEELLLSSDAYRHTHEKSFPKRPERAPKSPKTPPGPEANA